MPTNLYETDIHAWSQHQVELLRAEEFAAVDWHHIIEEIESLGVSQRHEIRNRLMILLMHLLKWHYQPTLQSRSWQSTITIRRDDLEIVLSDNPSLRARLLSLLPKPIRVRSNELSSKLVYRRQRSQPNARIRQNSL